MRFFLVFLIAIFISGCIGSETEKDAQNQDFRTAQTNYYANSFQSYATKSVAAMAGKPTWYVSLFDDGDYVELSNDFGVKTFAYNNMRSSVCRTRADQAIHLSWINIELDEKINLHNWRSVVSKLILEYEADNIGTMEKEGIRQHVNQEILSLPSVCQIDDIPEGVPVIMSRIDIPINSEETQESQEFKSLQCGQGFAGHVIQSRRVVKKNNDIIYTTAWTDFLDNCKPEIASYSIATVAQKVDGLLMGSISSTSAMRGAIEKSISEIECKEARSSKRTQGTSSNGDARQGQNHIQNQDLQDEKYSTCANDAEIVALGTIDAGAVTNRSLDTHSTECGGSSGFFDETLNGVIGRVSHTRWTGLVEYERDIVQHESDVNLQSASTVGRQNIQNWMGASIECDRKESLNITCSDAYPTMSSMSARDTRGFNYERTNYISGWANASELIPNQPTNPNWTYISSSSGCSWRETDRWGCSGTQISEGVRHRAHSSSSLGSALSVTSWNTASPARCYNRRTSTQSCGSGYTGSITITERRDYTSYSPGSGSWGGWYEESRADGCVADAPTSSYVNMVGRASATPEACVASAIADIAYTCHGGYDIGNLSPRISDRFSATASNPTTDPSVRYTCSQRATCFH